MIKVGMNWGSWLVGVYFDTEPLTLFAEVGPFWIEARRDEPYGLRLPCAWTMLRVTIARLKLDLRLDLDLNYWALGYAAADARDHGLYLGPLNLQVEIDKLYRERDFGKVWVRVHA
jgi:hypothetical protein